MIMQQDRSPSKYDNDFIFQNALVLVDHGDYDMAITLFDTVLTSDDSHKESIKWKAYCLKQIGLKEVASQEYIKLAMRSPSDENYYNLAECFYELGQDKLSVEYFQKALDIIDYDSPYLFGIYKYLGNLSVKSRDFEAAEEYYNKAYIQNAHSDELFVNYGTLEIQKENWDLAIDRFQQAIELNSNNEKAWIGLALIYRQKSDFDLSWADLKRAIDINPKNVTAIKLCLEWSLLEMEYDYAIEVMEKFLDPSNQNAEWLYTYAGLIYQSGDWKKTQILCKNILSLYPNHQPAIDLLKTAQRRVSS